MQTRRILLLLKWSCFFVFIGRAYQHLFWDAPYRAFLWDQKLLEPVINFLLNKSWKDYVTSLQTDNSIQLFTRVNGFFYALCAIVSLIITKKSHKILKALLLLGGINLIVLSLLLTKEKFYHLAMFFEHTIQFGCPFLLLYGLQKTDKKLLLYLKIGVALTFICHGVYAVGIHPLPANFVTMSLNILPFNEPNIKQFLFVMGVIDFIIGILIFIKYTQRTALLYACIWGFATALARIISGFTYDISLEIMHQYLYLVIYRLPHGIIPLLLLFETKNEVVETS